MTRAAATSIPHALVIAASDPRYTAVDIPPNVLLYLSQLAVQRGLACDEWFAGMGLQRSQLRDPSLRVSYRQASTVIQRAMQTFREADLGLAVGCSETPGSFGLLGWATTTSRTFSDATRAGAYTRHDVARGDVLFNLSHAYRGESRCNRDSQLQGTCQVSPNFSTGAAQQRTDARLGWTSQDQRWGVALYVNNLFDKRYVTGVSNISESVFGTPYASITPPRMWGVELNAKL